MANSWHHDLIGSMQHLCSQKNQCWAMQLAAKAIVWVTYLVAVFVLQQRLGQGLLHLIKLLIIALPKLVYQTLGVHGCSMLLTLPAILSKLFMQGWLETSREF
jgi:hypothetical protein